MLDIDNVLYSTPWFAWHPVKTECGSWVWWTWVRKETDERPLIYCGLLPTIRYYKI